MEEEAEEEVGEEVEEEVKEEVKEDPTAEGVYVGKGGAEYHIPEDGLWPDPTEDMPLDYLREMADAYEVKHTAKTSVKTLIKRIAGEMYEE